MVYSMLCELSKHTMKRKMQNREVIDLACIKRKYPAPMEMTLLSLRPVSVGCSAIQKHRVDSNKRLIGHCRDQWGTVCTSRAT